MHLSCKRCGSTSFVKHGFVRRFQRYRCKTCGFGYAATPKRAARKPPRPRLSCSTALAIRWLAKLLGVSAVSAYKWVRQAAEALPEPEVREEIREMELDELWHFLHAKKTSVGFGKPMIVTQDRKSVV